MTLRGGLETAFHNTKDTRGVTDTQKRAFCPVQKWVRQSGATCTPKSELDLAPVIIGAQLPCPRFSSACSPRALSFALAQLFRAPTVFSRQLTSNDAIGSPPLRCMVIAIHVRQLGSRRRALAPRRIRASQRALERWHALRRRALRRRELQATALAFCQVVGPARACSSNASCLLAHVLAVFLRACL